MVGHTKALDRKEMTLGKEVDLRLSEYDISPLCAALLLRHTVHAQGLPPHTNLLVMENLQISVRERHKKQKRN
jgi:hypothetical protein